MKSPTIQAKIDIAEAAANAVKTIADAANEAAKVVASAASEAIKIASVKNVDGKSDHDALTTLVADVKNIKESQDKFHVEMKDTLKRIEDGYGIQLTNHENRIITLEIAANEQKTVKKIVYGCVSFILLAVLSAITYLVVHK